MTVIRRRLPDYPPATSWNTQIRKALAAEPVAWCEWANDEGRRLCSRPAVVGDLCHGHQMATVKGNPGAAITDCTDRRNPCIICRRPTRREVGVCAKCAREAA